MPDTRSKDNASDFLSLYLFYAEQTEKLIERRAASGRYFLTINTTFVGLLGIALEHRPVDTSVWLAGFPVAGILVCLVWARLTRSYRVLTGVRYQVIHDLEGELVFAPYSNEWERIKADPAHRKYVSISRLEEIVPWLFALIYLVMLAAPFFVQR